MLILSTLLPPALPFVEYERKAILGTMPRYWREKYATASADLHSTLTLGSGFTTGSHSIIKPFSPMVSLPVLIIVNDVMTPTRLSARIMLMPARRISAVVERIPPMKPSTSLKRSISAPIVTGLLRASLIISPSSTLRFLALRYSSWYRTSDAAAAASTTVIPRTDDNDIPAVE